MFAKECKNVVQVQPFCLMVTAGYSFCMVNGKEVCVIPDHVIDGYKHLSCNGDDSLLVATALFQRLIFIIKIGILFCAFDSGKSALHKQGFEIMPAISDLCGFLLIGESMRYDMMDEADFPKGSVKTESSRILETVMEFW